MCKRLKTLKEASKEHDFSIKEYLSKLLKTTGYWSFNRFMVKHGFSLSYTLYIHRINAKNT